MAGLGMWPLAFDPARRSSRSRGKTRSRSRSSGKCAPCTASRHAQYMRQLETRAREQQRRRERSSLKRQKSARSRGFSGPLFNPLARSREAARRLREEESLRNKYGGDFSLSGDPRRGRSRRRSSGSRSRGNAGRFSGGFGGFSGGYPSRASRSSRSSRPRGKSGRFRGRDHTMMGPGRDPTWGRQPVRHKRAAILAQVRKGHGYLPASSSFTGRVPLLFAPVNRYRKKHPRSRTGHTTPQTPFYGRDFGYGQDFAGDPRRRGKSARHRFGAAPARRRRKSTRGRRDVPMFALDFGFDPAARKRGRSARNRFGATPGRRAPKKQSRSRSRGRRDFGFDLDFALDPARSRRRRSTRSAGRSRSRSRSRSRDFALDTFALDMRGMGRGNRAAARGRSRAPKTALWGSRSRSGF